MSQFVYQHKSHTSKATALLRRGGQVQERSGGSKWHFFTSSKLQGRYKAPASSGEGCKAEKFQGGHPRHSQAFLLPSPAHTKRTSLQRSPSSAKQRCGHYNRSHPDFQSSLSDHRQEAFLADNRILQQRRVALDQSTQDPLGSVFGLL